MTTSALDRAMSLRKNIGAGEQPHIKAPKKTLASGAVSALGGAGAGAGLVTALSVTNPITAGIMVGGGALLGGAEYFSS